MSQVYRESPPSPLLANYVECYWCRDDATGTPLHRILPDGCVDILFSQRHGEPMALTVVGLMTAPLLHAVLPGSRYFGVRFHPAMASALIPETALLQNKVEPLESFWGARARLLSEQLAHCGTAERMAAVIAPYLRPLQPAGAAERALGRLSPAGCWSVNRELSARHFRRVCLHRAGVPPKRLSRILRFRRAVERMGKIKGTLAQPNWAQFAVACGYYDQAHFISEFQAFAGLTPGRFFQSA